MKLKSTLVLGAMALGLSLQANATVIAIIDSGTDLSHPALVDHKWFNAKEGTSDDAVDNDNNGFIDDINGWNFADGNNKLFDKSFLGTFSPDTYEFFAVQTRLLKGTGTQADLDWIQAKEKDENFIAGLETFGNFVHGSHVAGIASKNVVDAKIMVMKIIPTKRPAPASVANAAPPAACTGASKIPDSLLKAGLKVLASQQAKPMGAWGKYVDKGGARVANCSFGISTANATGIIAPVLTTLMKCTPSDDVVKTWAAYFVSQVVTAQAVLVTSAPKTLFVIAAGNDGMDNDVYPSSPANIKTDNTISVAATLDYLKIASFSNYGNTTVEVAAPGVGIESSIPGGLYLTVSGTSQATPFVANAAGRIIDLNPGLTNAEVKQILMGTVDLKPFLSGKVVSGGIVNQDRAETAAQLSKSLGIANAIKASRAQVGDVQPHFEPRMLRPEYEGYVMPLPTLFN